MPRLLVLCSRVVQLGLQRSRCLAHSEPQHPRNLSPAERAVGILVIFSAFLTPPAYVLSNLKQFRRG